MPGVTRQCFRRTDRFSKLPRRLDELERADWFDGLAQPPQSLIQPAVQFGAEALCERRPRLASNVTNAFKAEAMQLIDHVMRQAEKSERQAL